MVTLSISVIWYDPPRETQNVVRFISHYDFRMGCDPPPSPLFIIQRGGVGGSHLKMKLGGETRSLGL